MGFIWIRVKLSLHKNPYYLAIAEKIAVNFIQKIEKLVIFLSLILL